MQTKLLDEILRAEAVAEFGRAHVVQRSTLDEPTRSVDAVLASEEPVNSIDFATWSIIREVLLMDGVQYPTQVPLLDTHDRSSVRSVLGSVRNIRVEAGKLVGRQHYAADPDAVNAFNKVRDGHVTDNSIGARRLKWEDIPPNTTRTVAGREFASGAETLRITMQWELTEDSACAVGADRTAKVRRDEGIGGPATVGRTDGREEGSMFETWLKARGLDPAALSETARAALQKDFEAEVKRAASGLAPASPPTPAQPAPSPAPAAVAVAVADPDVLRAEGVKRERERVAAITAECEGFPDEIARKAIADGLDLAQTQAMLLKHVRESRTASVGTSSVTVRERRDDLARVLTDSVCLRQDIVRVAPTPNVDPNEVRRFAGLGLQDLSRIWLASSGVDVSRMTPDDLFEAICDQHRGVQVRRDASTFSLPQMLGVSANKILEAAYAMKPPTFTLWAGKREAKDFKSHTDIRMSDFASLVEIGKDGKFQDATISEGYETFQAKTYGRQFIVDRKSFINDDLGGFARIPATMARACARNVDDLGYALLVSNSGVGPAMTEDGYYLVSASRTTPNYITGATYVLGKIGLEYVLTLMGAVTGLEGKPLNLQGKFLLVPNALRFTAEELVKSPYWMASGLASTSAFTQAPSSNTHQGRLELIVEPRLDSGTAGTTAFWVVADAAEAASLVLVSLRGNPNPVIRRNDPTDVLGFGWQVYHDVGVAAVDWRGIVRSAGA